MSEEEYVCSLDDASLAKAKTELNEEPNERLGAVETFRQWVKQQPHLTCPTDTAYLLMFLRTAKFSQLKARERLEKYLTLVTEVPQWFHNVDPREPETERVLKAGVYIDLGKHPDGQRLGLFREAAYDADPKKWNKNAVMKAYMFAMYYQMLDEPTQVNGGTYLDDHTGMTMKHQMFFDFDDMKKAWRMMDGGPPFRYKAFHMYNAGSVFESIIALCKPFISKKLMDRMHTHSTMEPIYKLIPKELIPTNYLPDDYTGPSPGDWQSMLDKQLTVWQSDEVRNKVLWLSDPRWGINKALKPAEVPQASFRKLNID